MVASEEEAKEKKSVVEVSFSFLSSSSSTSSSPFFHLHLHRHPRRSSSSTGSPVLMPPAHKLIVACAACPTESKPIHLLSSAREAAEGAVACVVVEATPSQAAR